MIRGIKISRGVGDGRSSCNSMGKGWMLLQCGIGWETATREQSGCGNAARAAVAQGLMQTAPGFLPTVGTLYTVHHWLGGLCMPRQLPAQSFNMTPRRPGSQQVSGHGRRGSRLAPLVVIERERTWGPTKLIEKNERQGLRGTGQSTSGKPSL